tara:strand:- start:278 stop:1360 length:1083 start_codon:yes stop_codon:yes gene_type:complete
MAIAGGNIKLDSTEGMDKITQTEKVTSPYFSDGSTSLTSGQIKSSSLTDTNEKYFFGISKSTTLTTEEFNVTFGSTNGFGVNVETGTKSETEAIYKQYAGMLLAPTEVTGGFFISSQGLAGQRALATKDTEIFVMSARRSNMKDRINKGTWTIEFSGSSIPNSGSKLKLTDDSKTVTPTATPVGDRYNIVSGTAGTVVSASTQRTFGHFYPDMGILVFSAAELSASLPGNNDQSATVFNSGSQMGFHFRKTTNEESKPALRFINCLTKGSLTFRDEEDQVSAQYFCRVRSGQMNFTNNPTFVSGSLNELRQSTMKDNPTTFITSVQLYNDNGEMVAVGNLSTPLKKNFSSEATIKVKLNY